MSKLSPFALLAGQVMRAASWAFHDVAWTMRAGLARGLRRRFGPGLRPRTRRLTPEEQFLTALDLNGATVFDVGGYIGLYTLFFARAVGPQGRVITCEPNPRNVAELRKNVQLNHFSNVEIIPVGVGAAAGVAHFQLDAVSPARGRVVAAADGADLTVPLASLDALLLEHTLPPPDFIKVDVEGLELDVIKGAAKLLAAHTPELFIELHGSINAELVERLRAYGYTLYHVEAAADLTSGALPNTLNGHIFATLPQRRNWAHRRGAA